MLGQRMNHDSALFYVYVGRCDVRGLVMTIENYYTGLDQKYYRRHFLLEEVVEEIIRGWLSV
jgi:hypothetical protein